MASIVVRHVVGVGRILQEPFAFLNVDPDNQRLRFRRAVSGEARHEGATNLQYRRSIVIRLGFDVWKAEPHGPDQFEIDRRCLPCQSSLHRARVFVLARRDQASLRNSPCRCLTVGLRTAQTCRRGARTRLVMDLVKVLETDWEVLISNRATASSVYIHHRSARWAHSSRTYGSRCARCAERRAFPLAAIATLAIGIGATTAIFSTVNAALLKPLPYPSPDDLYSLRTTLTDGRVTTGNLSPVEVVRLNDPSLSIVRAAGLASNDVTLLRNDGTPLKTKAYAVSEGFFDLFGLPMTIGGVTNEPPARNAPPTVVVSYRMWQDLYGGDSAVVGKPIRFAEITTTVAGVAPREFDTPHGANFWFQIPLDPQGVGHNLEGFMRVKPGTTIDRARSEMASVMASVARDFPASATARSTSSVRSSSRSSASWARFSSSCCRPRACCSYSRA